MRLMDYSGASNPGRDPATRAAIGWALQKIESGGQLDDAFVDAEVELVLDGGGTLRLRCERWLGAGGRGEVFECSAIIADGAALPAGRLALKVARADQDEAVRAEADIHRRLAARLAGNPDAEARFALPGFVGSGRVGVEGRPARRAAILMECVPGITVEQALNLTTDDRARGRRVNVARWLRVTACVLESLRFVDAAHGAEFGGRGQHGDLKPSNVLVRSFGFGDRDAPRATIIDLGAWGDRRADAREGTPGTDREDMKAAGAMLGRMLEPWTPAAGVSEAPEIGDAQALRARLLADGFVSSDEAIRELRALAARIDPAPRGKVGRAAVITALVAGAALIALLAIGAWETLAARRCSSELASARDAMLRAGDRDIARRLADGEGLVDRVDALTAATGNVLGPLWSAGLVDASLGILPDRSVQGVRSSASDCVALLQALDALDRVQPSGGLDARAWQVARELEAPVKRPEPGDPGLQPVCDGLRNELATACRLDREFRQYAERVRASGPAAEGCDWPDEVLGRLRAAPDGSPRAASAAAVADELDQWFRARAASVANRTRPEEWLDLASQAGQAGDLAGRLRGSHPAGSRLLRLKAECDALAQELRAAERVAADLRAWRPGSALPDVQAPGREAGSEVPALRSDFERVGVEIRRLEAHVRQLKDASDADSQRGSAARWSKCRDFNIFAGARANALVLEAERFASDLLAVNCKARRTLALIGPIEWRIGDERDLDALMLQAADDRKALEQALSVPDRLADDEAVKQAVTEGRKSLEALALNDMAMPAIRELAQLRVALRDWTPQRGRGMPSQPLRRLDDPTSGDRGPKVVAEIARGQDELRARLELLKAAAAADGSPKAQKAWEECEGFNEYARERTRGIGEESQTTANAIRSSMDRLKACLAEPVDAAKVASGLDGIEGRLDADVRRFQEALDSIPPASSVDPGVVQARSGAEELKRQARVVRSLMTALKRIASDRSVPLRSVQPPEFSEAGSATALEQSLHEALRRSIESVLSADAKSAEDRREDLKALGSWRDDGIQWLAATAARRFELAVSAADSAGQAVQALTQVQFNPPAPKERAVIAWLDVLAAARADLRAAEQDRAWIGAPGEMKMARSQIAGALDSLIGRIEAEIQPAKLQPVWEVDGQGKQWAEWLEALRARADDPALWDDGAEAKASRERLRRMLSDLEQSAWTGQMESWWRTMRKAWAYWCREGAAEFRMTLGEFREVAGQWQARQNLASEERRRAVAAALELSGRFDVQLRSVRGRALAKAYDRPRARFEDSRISGDFEPRDGDSSHVVGTLRIESESRWLALSVSWISGKLDVWGFDPPLDGYNSAVYGQTGSSFPPANLCPGDPYEIGLGCDDGGVQLTVVFLVAADGRNGNGMTPGTIFESAERTAPGNSEQPFRAPSRNPAQ